MMLLACVAGDVLKKKVIVVLPFDKLKEFAGIPFTVKSLASRVAGSTGSVRSTAKAVSGAEKTPPQSWLLTEQPAGVSVGVGVAVGVTVAVGVGVAPPAGAWIATAIGEPVLKNSTVALAFCGG